jgi:hypothetical protein
VIIENIIPFFPAATIHARLDNFVLRASYIKIVAGASLQVTL